MENNYQAISKMQIAKWLLGRTFFLAILVAIFVFVRNFLFAEVILEDAGSDVAATVLRVTDIVLGCILALSAINAWIMPFFQYAAWKYRISDDKIEIRHGVIHKTLQLVPVSRIQQVSVLRGITQRIFGVASLQIDTAGNTAVITGIEKAQAEKMAEEFNARVNVLSKQSEEVGSL